MFEDLYSVDDFENWIQKSSDDPFTSFLDEIMFPLYKYEYYHCYIVEAFLPKLQPEEICLSCKNNELSITLQKPENNKERKVSFPIIIDNKSIQSTIQDGLLQIVIKK
ncbi:Hsp20/alpha crystallin family protein [Bacillus sp. JJ722]|uniref:Hsp20/alpha crystallin family protein n=1 Tax=Bacillus sp. JJ722 TaxID=3122973 RepID=UPI003000E90C